MFQRYRTCQEVKDKLTTRNVRLSISEIDYLGRKFVTYLAAGHRRAAPRISQAMEFNGGYILHLVSFTSIFTRLPTSMEPMILTQRIRETAVAAAY